MEYVVKLLSLWYATYQSLLLLLQVMQKLLIIIFLIWMRNLNKSINLTFVFRIIELETARCSLNGLLYHMRLGLQFFKRCSPAFSLLPFNRKFWGFVLFRRNVYLMGINLFIRVVQLRLLLGSILGSCLSSYLSFIVRSHIFQIVLHSIYSLDKGTL